MRCMPTKYLVVYHCNFKDKPGSPDSYQVVRSEVIHIPWFTYEGVQFVRCELKGKDVIFEDTCLKTVEAVCRDLNRAST